MGEDIKTTAEAAESAALPKAHAVHTKDRKPSAEQEPLPKGVAKTPVERKSPAEWAYERLVLYIKNFEEQLDNDQEVAMGFTGGDAGVMRIEGMGYYAPDILTFYGSDPTGTKTQQVQHVSQLNVMLRALPKEIDQPEPNRIGFRLARDLEEG
jgi:hypothetical protein